CAIYSFVVDVSTRQWGLALMASASVQGRLRKAAAILAVFACLLVGPLGQGAFALCLGSKGHTAVEVLPHGNHGRIGAPATLGFDLAAGVNADTRLCVDIPLLQNAAQEKTGSEERGSTSVAAALIAAPPPAGPPPNRIFRLSSKIEVNPALLHHRTVVLLI
ncbi:MAG: hypothetical protein AB1563_12140, partial [Bacillota bacterium]